MNYKLEKHHFDCECGSDEHTFSLLVDEENGEMFMSVFLSQYRNFFKRVAVAVKYVFGYKCKYGHWDTTILDRDTTARLAALCQRSVDARDAYEAKLNEAAKSAMDAMVDDVKEVHNI